MTYAAGFYTPDAIYLTADTAASGSLEFSIYEDTFFAQPAVRESFAVNDNRMKLFQISTSCLVAAAGDEEKIYVCVDYLRIIWSAATSLNELFDELELETQYSSSNDVVLIVAASTTAGLRMGMWNPRSPYSWAAKEGGIPASAICSGAGRVIPGLTASSYRIRFMTLPNMRTIEPSFHINQPGSESEVCGDSSQRLRPNGC